MERRSIPTSSTTPVEIPECLEIRSSGIHGQGAFARKPIGAGVRIIEYVGERISKAEAARRCEESNPYIFTINDDWDIDGSVPWNPARFFNHSCEPNCESRQEDERIWIWSLRPIEPGEELTYNYGYDLTEWRDYPCECGAKQCLGYILAEEFHDQVRRQLELEREASAAGTVNRTE